MSEQTGMRERKAEGGDKRRDENAEQQPAGEQIEGQQRNEFRRGGRDNRGRGNRPPQQNQQSARSSLNMNELRELAELINEHGFTDFEFENENIRVRLRKELAPQIVQAAAPTSSVQAQTIQTPDAETATNSSVIVDADANLKKITSPIVGTFYRAPSPEAEPFVKVGSQVSAETTVCIVEAMKLMNEIPAEISGEIIKIYVENGQPVEYGQPLFAVK